MSFLGRRRAITMCHYLLESLCGKSDEAVETINGQPPANKFPNYDIKGLFLASTTQLLNEQCNHTKNKLEDLLKTIIYISRQKAKYDGKTCQVFELIYQWCMSETVMCRSIGFKLMTLYLPSEISVKQFKGFSQPAVDIFNAATKYLGEYKDDNSSPIIAYLLANIILLFKLLSGCFSKESDESVRVAAAEIVFVTAIRSGNLDTLFVHENVAVRKQSLELLENIFQLRLYALINKDILTSVDAPKSKKKKKNKNAEDKLFIPAEILKNILTNICELAKVDVKEENLLLNNLSMLYDICVIDPHLSKCVKEDSQPTDDKYITPTYVYKKARSIFIHEKFHINNETSRRQLFYKFVLKILQTANENKLKAETQNGIPANISVCSEVKDLITKHMTKDRKQTYLEEIIVNIEKEIQDLGVE